MNKCQFITNDRTIHKYKCSDTQKSLRISDLLITLFFSTIFKEFNKLDRLQEASVQIINHDGCINFYKEQYAVLANTKVCVQGEEKSSCGVC